MEPTREEMLAQLAREVFNKRQRLLQAVQASAQSLDNDNAPTLEAECRAAAQEYSLAQAAFARAMKTDKPTVG